jgi:aspartyl-tRNA synthetase
MQRVLTSQLHDQLDKEITLKGWVDNRRDHGKLIFFDLRDRGGYVQCVVLPNHEQALKVGNDLRPEWVVEIKGKVNQRPERMVNDDQLNGDLEIEVLEIKVLNQSKTPPFDVTTDGYEIGEEHRLKYRYLDMRRPRLQRNLRERSRIANYIRAFLNEKDFVEVETPLLTKSTPEGARDFVVPSRQYPGDFYALPQSPQQYKQLLMAGGIERYYQIAKCLRDEDSRKDRQPEFTQLDMEMSFVDREDVMALNEALLIKLVKSLYPNKKIKETPFPRLSYKEAMEKYGSDRPDLRQNTDDPDELAFCWIIDFPFFEKTASTDDVVVDGAEWTFTHNPFSSPVSEHKEDLLSKKNIADIKTTQYDIVLNGYEIGGGSIRAHNVVELKAVLEIIGLDEDTINKDFRHMLAAFEQGTPPHGGIAWGLDRLVSLLMSEPNIREVIAFPKTGEGRDPMMESPASINQSQLNELGLEISKKENDQG